MIQFTHPIYLLLLPVLFYFTWRFSNASLADLTRGRRRFSLGLRMAFICLLVLAVSGIQVVRSSRNLAVTFVLDVSDSVAVEKQQEALDYIRQALKNKREGDYIGLVVFGADASVEIAPDKSAKIDRIYSIPSRSYTDISQALGLAIASFPEDAAKRIVLLSDGNENLGKALDQAAMADSTGIVIDTVPIINDVAKETLLDRIITPSEVKIGEPFDLKLIASAKNSANAEIRLLRNGQPSSTKVVSLSPGKNVLTFTQTIDKPGVYSFEALMKSDSDTLLDNNRALGTTTVRGKPRVLFIEGTKGQTEPLAKALSASDISVDVKTATGIPTSLDEMRQYDSVILSNVPAMAMTPDQMKLLEAGVKDLGIGLGMIGGDQSFGAGGYFNTPIEQALPVDMSIRKQKVVPSMSVVVVIDKSGSMGMMQDGRTKISLANEAAINVVKLLQPIDKVGVIFCHDYPTAIVPLTNPTNKEAISQKISTVNAEGGGITVFPSLQAAYRMIAASGTRQKHVMMLCDGDDCDQPEGCVALAAEMNKKGITVTSVAFGEGKDVPFMKSMAAAGGGNFYLARRARELPYIFTKDVMTISKTLIIEEPFRPSIDPSAQVMSGIDWDSMPPLLGYVAASPKPTAEILMKSHKDDPIYVQWQYGLGRSIAFTSDAQPKWAVRWLGWPGFTKFWAQAVRWSMKKSSKADFQTSVDIDQAVGKVVVDAIDKSGSFVNYLKLESRVVMPDMKSAKLTLQQTAPGRYEAQFLARQVGTYTVNVVEKQKDKDYSQTSSITVPYPPEYKDIKTNRKLLEQISTTTHGKFGPTPAMTFSPNVQSARIPSDLWWTLTFLAMLLFPLDIAIRRVALDASEVRQFAVQAIQSAKSWKSKRKKHQYKPEEETVGRLLQSRESRKKTAEHQDWVQPPTQPSDTAKKVTDEAETFTKSPEPKTQQILTDEETTSRLLQAKKRARDK